MERYAIARHLRAVNEANARGEPIRDTNALHELERLCGIMSYGLFAFVPAGRSMSPAELAETERHLLRMAESRAVRVG